MSEAPSRTSDDRNLSEGGIVGPVRIEFPALVTAKDGFQDIPVAHLPERHFISGEEVPLFGIAVSTSRAR
jgi:hypothetical protein